MAGCGNVSDWGFANTLDARADRGCAPADHRRGDDAVPDQHATGGKHDSAAVRERRVVGSTGPGYRRPRTERRGGRYFSSRTAWPLSFRSSAITPRNLPVGKSKATTWSWPTQYS